MKRYINEIDLHTFLAERLNRLGWVTESFAGVNELIHEPTLRAALKRINPTLTTADINKTIKWIRGTSNLHRAIIRGLTIKNDKQLTNLKLIDTQNPTNNTYQLLQEITVTNGDLTRRADMILLINGLPVALIELKSPSAPTDSLITAARQLDNYAHEFPNTLGQTTLHIVIDGHKAHVGSTGTQPETYPVWGEDTRGITDTNGLLHPHNLTQYLHKYVLTRTNQPPITIQTHQIQAITNIQNQLQNHPDETRVGTIWHTQGSGKSITILLTATEITQRNPNTLTLIITDRLEIETQLHKEFQNHKHHLPPTHRIRTQKQIQNLHDAKGIHFITIQKFYPNNNQPLGTITDRKDIIILVDEAHRSHTGFDNPNNKIGYAHHLRQAFPNARYIAYTGTPTQTPQHSTTTAFGDVLHHFSTTESIERGVTLPVTIVSKPIEVQAAESRIQEIQAYLDDADLTARERRDLEDHWAAVAAIMLTKNRIDVIAEDITRRLEMHRRNGGGKALAYCMNRRHCILLHDAIKKLRPEWFSDADDAGRVKVIISGSAGDEREVLQHARTPERRARILEYARDPNHSIDLLISCDLLTTGFNAPAFDVIFNDKIMRGNHLLQAFARVNRPRIGKVAPTVTDYAGITRYIHEAIVTHHAAPAISFLIDIERDQQAAFDRVKKLLPTRYHKVPATTEAKLQLVDATARYLRDAGKDELFVALVDALMEQHHRNPRTVTAERNAVVWSQFRTVALVIARVTPERFVSQVSHDAFVRVALDEATVAVAHPERERVILGFGEGSGSGGGELSRLRVNAVVGGFSVRFGRVLRFYNENQLTCAFRSFVLLPNIRSAHELVA